MHKWFNEIILEKVPPFSWVPRGYNVALQLFIMEIVGTSIGLLFSLPVRSILYGSLAIFVVSLWSFLAFKIGSTVRRLKPPSAPLERNVIDKYQKSLFHPRRYEFGIAALIFLIILSYLISFGRGLVSHWLGGNLSPILLFFVALLFWDVSYRLGLGLWSAIVGLKRSINLSSVSKKRSKMRYTAYSELRTLKRLDIVNLSFGLVSLLLYPVGSTNIIFFAGLLGYAVVILFFSILSFIKIGSIPGFPLEIIWLLNEGKFGYVGTSDKEMRPHLTPVTFVFVGRTIYFIISKISKKLQNIRENNKIAFLVDMRDPNNLYNNRAVLFTGKAKVYNLPNAILNIYPLLKVRNRFYRKYPRYVHKYVTEKEKLPHAWRTTLFVSRMLVKLEVEKIVYWREAHPIRLPLM